MKLFFRTLCLVMLVGCGLGRPGSAATQHYKVIAADSGGAEGEQVAREMENRFAVYNRLFRFESFRLESPLKVQIFLHTGAYDEYVSARLGTTRPGAVYLHYSDAGKRELVINRFSPDEAQALPYQAFIQYLRAFIPNPPQWMREGFAIYFSTLNFSADGDLVYKENLSWLETVKNLGFKSPPLEAILLGGQIGDQAIRAALSWAAVSFFLKSGNEDYFRSLTESFMLLSATATAAENAGVMANRIFLWNDAETMNRDYLAYLASRRTFPELMEQGQKAYAAKDAMTAELAFFGALEQKPAHYAPYYYLGLLAYENREFDLAERYYLSSLDYGAEKALVFYALGVNAADAGRSEEAAEFLRQAADAAPDRYKEKAKSLIE